MVNIGGVFKTDETVCDSSSSEIDICATLKEIDISLQLKVDGVPTKWSDNGYIPKLRGSKRVTIRLTCGENVWGFNVATDKSRTVTGAKNHSIRAEVKIYHKKITVIDGVETNYPTNCIRLLRLLEGRHFKVTEIGIPFQNMDGFLTVQDVYEGDCYRGSDGSLVCPPFDDSWTSLSDFISQIQIRGFEKLPHIINYQPRPKQKNLLPFKGGIVKWFNVNAGYGVIDTCKGDVYVNHKSIISEDYPCLLKKGAEVTIKDLIVTKDGTFKIKALGVRVV